MAWVLLYARGVPLARNGWEGTQWRTPLPAPNYNFGHRGPIALLFQFDHFTERKTSLACMNTIVLLGMPYGFLCSTGPILAFYSLLVFFMQLGFCGCGSVGGFIVWVFLVFENYNFRKLCEFGSSKDDFWLVFS